MQHPIHDWLVDIDIAVPDFQVEAAFRIGTNPRLVMDGRTLPAEVRQGNQVARLALLAFGQIG